jgi:Uma2 family endonuclease
MAIAVAHKQPLMTVRDLLGFLRSRPDEERWELIEGIPMMMAPPTIRHQRIASNLERHLNDALRARKPEWRADREIGLALSMSGYYRPEPEVAVVDADIDEEASHASRFYLVAEVVSTSDESPFGGSDRSVIETKLDFYRSHEHNRCIIVVRQDALEVAVHLRRSDRTWPEHPLVLTSAPDVIEIEGIGRVCAGDLYEGTSLAARPGHPA